MSLVRSTIAVTTFGLIVLMISAQLALGKKKDKYAGASQMDDHKRAEHALNRLTFGPRAGDVDRVMAMGVDKWIDVQLHPEKINDSAVESRLAPFQTLRMNTQEMVEAFPPRQVIKAVSDGKLSLPANPMRRAVYESQLERFQEKQTKKTEKANVATASAASTVSGQEHLLRYDEARRRQQR